MAIWTEALIAKKIKLGHGQGLGKDYRSWFTAKETNSIGQSEEFHSNKVGRCVNIVSKIEKKLFVILEWDSSIEELWEQYPIDFERKVSQECAREAGIRYPCYPKTKIPAVLTVDFMVMRLVDGEEQYTAYDAKPNSAAEDDREMDKIEIHRRLCEKLGIEHKLVFETLIPEQLAENLIILRSALIEPEGSDYVRQCTKLGERIAAEISHASKRTILSDYCLNLEGALGSPPGMIANALSGLLYNRKLLADFSKEAFENIRIGQLEFVQLG